MKNPRIAIVHNVPAAEGSSGQAASQDVLHQVAAVEKALDRLEYPSCRIPFTRDLGAFMARFRKEGARIIFNLCETVDEEATLAAHPAAVFELLGIPFTGSPANALMYSTDKATAKRIMAAAGIETPRFVIYDGIASAPVEDLSFPVIIKPRHEDASIGIDQESIFQDPEKLLKELPAYRSRFGPVVAEEYIAGREFNISLFGYPEPTTLPPAEIDFSAFPDDLYSILGYRAKWDAASFEYNNSPRRFPDDIPPATRRNLEEAARCCFRLFQLRDYGRVDMRVTADGDLSVLEVNANPCLSPDAGFVAALERAGVTYADMVGSMVAWARGRATRP